MPITIYNLAGHPLRTRQSGFSLLELLVVVMLLGVLTSIALPIYQGYRSDAERLVLLNNVASMQIFQEDHRLRFGRYGAGVYDLTNPDEPITTLTEAIGWAPANQASNIVYLVTASTDNYTVMATKGELSVSKTFP